MTPRKLRKFRHQLDYVLSDSFPRADKLKLAAVAARLERLMVYEAFELVEMEHERDCACWHCLLSLHAQVYRHACEMKVAREMADEHD